MPTLDPSMASTGSTPPVAMGEPSLRKHVPISAAVTAGVLGRMDVLLALMAIGAMDISVVAALLTNALAELVLVELAVLVFCVFPFG